MIEFQVWYRRLWDDDFVFDKGGFTTHDQAQEWADKQWDGFDEYQGLTREALEERGTDFEVRKVESN